MMKTGPYTFVSLYIFFLKITKHLCSFVKIVNSKQLNNAIAVCAIDTSRKNNKNYDKLPLKVVENILKGYLFT